jgi:hypothetical protein
MHLSTYEDFNNKRCRKEPRGDSGNKDFLGYPERNEVDAGGGWLE